MVAESRSPETPDELSLSKNIRSPASEAERHEDVRLVLAAPPGELVLRLDRRHHAEVVAALLDRGDVDLHVLPRPVGDHRVAGLVDRDRVPFPLDVLDVLGRAELLELLGLDHVLVRDDVAAVPDRDDQRLVDHVLDRGAGRVRGDRGELVDLLGGQLVRDLGEVPLVGADAARLGRVADPVHAVDAAGPQQRLVERGRRVGRHHDQDAVVRRRLRPHAEHPPDHPVDEPARLLQSGQLGEQGLQRAHAAAALPPPFIMPPTICLFRPAPGSAWSAKLRAHHVAGDPPLAVG